MKLFEDLSLENPNFIQKIILTPKLNMIEQWIQLHKQ